MGVATFAGVPFRIDPTSVLWTYSIKTAEKRTLGGRVVQVLGAVIGPMTVTGSFGRGGWEEQSRFLERMQRIADSQVAESAPGKQGARPVRFTYAPERWDFLVYLAGFEQQGGVVVLDVDTVNVTWTLNLHIVEDNSGLKQVAMDAYIARISAGLGWAKKDWSGPMRGISAGTATGAPPPVPTPASGPRSQ